MIHSANMMQHPTGGTGTMARSSMDNGDSMFARPEQPASDPCVRVFAELALKEIRLAGGDAGLLSDKGAFSEFMDKVNESVLLGHREPPAAASVIEGDQTTSDDEEQEEEPSSFSFQSAVGRSAVPSGFDAKHNDPFTKPPVFPRSSMHRDRRISRPSASPPLAQGSRSRSRSRVRFGVDGDGDSEEGHARETLPEKMQRRKHRDSAGGRKGPDGREEAINSKGPLVSDLSGPSLLQELRRWRSRALGEMRKARPPSFPRPPTSLQPPLPLPSPPQRASPVHRSSPDRLSPAPRGADSSPRGADSGGAEEVSAVERPAARRSFDGGVGSGGREMRTLAELAKGGDCIRGGGEGDGYRSISDATSTATEISEALGGGSQVESVQGETEDGPPPPNLEAATTAASSGRQRQGNGVVSVGGGMVDGREGGAGLAGWRRVEEEPMELSLDLSDCSDEKLGHLLERGPRRGRLSESQGGRGGGAGGGGRGRGYQAYGAVYAC